MISIKNVLLTFFVCIAVVGGTEGLWANEKAERNFNEFKLWHKLLQYDLSSNGIWAMWRMMAGPDQDTLYIWNIHSGREYKYENASGAEFSGDSRWAVFSVPGKESGDAGIAYQIKLVELQTGEERGFSGMESSSFTKDSKYLLLKGRSKDMIELNLFHLEKKQTKNIANVQEYTTDPTGSYLAYIVKTASGQGNGVEVMDLSDYSVSFPRNDGTKYEKLKWTDKGLVFMKILSDSVRQNQKREIRVLRNAGTRQQAFCLDTETLADFPVNMNISEFYAPQWSADGKILFFGIAPERIPSESDQVDKANVDIWHWRDQEVQSRQEKRYYINRSRTYLCAWWPEKNRWKQLTDSSLYDVAAVSSDGAYILAVDDCPYRPHYREPHRDIYVLETSTGKRMRLLENTILSASFSRDSKYVYYFKDKNWWAYDLTQGKYINLTEGITTELCNVYYDGPIDIQPSFGEAGWLKNDKAFCFYDEYDIWSVEPETLRLKRLTNGRENQVTFRKMQRGEFILDKSLLLKASGDDGQIGIFRFDSKGQHQQLMYGTYNFSRLDKASDVNVYLFSREDNITAPELFWANENFTDLHQLTQSNIPSDGFVFRKSELVHYKNSQGTALKGALFYPVNYQKGKKYPMIVHIYETLSDRLNDFVYPSAKDAYNTMNYVLQGYFVFQPDIAYEVNHPGESSVDCVTAAMKEILTRTDIDSGRLGLIGHSWGAYQTAYIATQTSLFAAAIAGAPLTNMVSMYNSIYWENGRANQEMFETSQARFRSPWWQIPRQYIKNSPVFQAQHIRTPLLILFGTDDGAVNWSQGLEMYITMRRLGKPCILLAYKDEGHTIGGEANQMDQVNRILDFFDYYLQDKPVADWILKGRTYLEKKGE